MYGVHSEIMSKIDEIDEVVKRRDDLVDTGIDQKFTELRQLVQRAWDETGHGIGGFGPPCD